MTSPSNSPAGNDVQKELTRMSRRSFATAAIGAALGGSGFAWLKSQETEDGLPWILRRALRLNERLARWYYRSGRLAPTFPADQAHLPKENGGIGLDSPIDLDTWRLKATGVNGRTVELTLDAIKALPKIEMVTELKCVEGWSTIVHWGGARLSDLATRYELATISGRKPNLEAHQDDLAGYASLATPDASYFVGLDIETALHPQTLLCYEMAGLPLTLEHGAPLRLVTPLKYGIKQIKRIGRIEFTHERPADYWAQRGYDWYAGH